MDIQTLKYEIIESITKTNDNSLLKTLKSIIDSKSNAKETWYDELSEEEIQSINRGFEDHEKGEVLTSKEFWSEYGD